MDLLCLFYFLIFPQKIIKKRFLPEIITVILSCGLPYLAASNQIYPDLIAGEILLFCIWILFSVSEPNELSVRKIILLSFCIASLPWFHIRFLLPAFFVFLYSAFLVVQRYLSSRRYFYFIYLCLIPIIAISLLGYYNYTAFGNFLGTYHSDAITLDIKKIFMIFSGLLIDSQQGILIQQPLILFLGLIGIAPLAKNNIKRFIFLCLIFLSINVPNSMHLTNLYGGYSFWGRFGWASSVIWIYPISYAANELSSRRLGKFYLLTACISSVIIQTAYINIWARQNNYLLNLNTIQQWGGIDLISDVLQLPIQRTYSLPYFHDSETYLYHFPNFLAIILIITLIIFGYKFFVSQNQNKLWKI